MGTRHEQPGQTPLEPELFGRRFYLHLAAGAFCLLALTAGLAFLETKVPAAAAPSIIQVTGATTPSATARLGSQHGRGGLPLPSLVTRSIQVGEGDTLMALLVSAGAAPEDASEAVQALAAIYNPRSLKVGQQITVTFAAEDGDYDTQRLVDVTVSADVDRKVLASRMLSPDDSFSGQEQRQELTPGLSRFSGFIDDSLFEAAGRAGLPPAVTAELIRLYSFDVDFQRDIHPGDTFEVKVERWFDGDGRPAKDGAITYASLTLSGVTHQLWRFQPPKGEIDYFDSAGSSVRKALLKTPIDGARITSGFGMRQHPLLGYTKMHKGLDFGASTGTPIMAAGDGSVAFAGDKGTYGRYVQLKHPAGFATAYAHMSRIAVKRGQSVRQGQIIGYVGTTGRSTGPHLHYEVLAGDKQVNPAGLKLPTGHKLAGAELASFQAARLAIDTAPTQTPVVTAVRETDR